MKLPLHGAWAARRANVTKPPIDSDARQVPRIGWIHVAVHGTAILAVAAVLSLVVPGFARTWEEFDLPLPAVSKMIVALSRPFASWGGWLLLTPVLLLDAAALAGLPFLGPQGKSLAGIWFVAGLVTVACFGILLLLGLLLPWLQLIEGLS